MPLDGYGFYQPRSPRHYRRARRFHGPRPSLFQKPLRLGQRRGPHPLVVAGLAVAAFAAAGAGADPGAAKAVARPVVRPIIHAVHPAPPSCSAPVSDGTPAGNQALGDTLAGCLDGWTGAQATCLNQLWTRESGWSATADTRVTHAGGDGPGSAVFAYGIAQARPASKYPVAARPADLGGRSDPATQIKWGLADIHDVYGDPCTALGHENTHGWY